MGDQWLLRPFKCDLWNLRDVIWQIENGKIPHNEFPFLFEQEHMSRIYFQLQTVMIVCWKRQFFPYFYPTSISAKPEVELCTIQFPVVDVSCLNWSVNFYICFFPLIVRSSCSTCWWLGHSWRCVIKRFSTRHVGFSSFLSSWDPRVILARQSWPSYKIYRFKLLYSCTSMYSFSMLELTFVPLSRLRAVISRTDRTENLKIILREELEEPSFPIRTPAGVWRANTFQSEILHVDNGIPRHSNHTFPNMSGRSSTTTHYRFDMVRTCDLLSYHELDWMD